MLHASADPPSQHLPLIATALTWTGTLFHLLILYLSTGIAMTGHVSRVRLWPVVGDISPAAADPERIQHPDPACASFCLAKRS